MAFFSRLFGRGGDTVQTGTQNTRASSTKNVSFDQAMSQSAFWASTRLLTETVAAMPLVCYKRDLETNVKQPLINYDLWRVLNYRPNSYQTRTEFFEQIMLNLVTRGNSYCVIGKTGKRITSLTPIPSAQTEIVLLDDGTEVYKLEDASGNVNIYASSSIWHVKIFGNGRIGLSPLSYAASTLGMSIDLSSRMATLSANGGKTNGVLTIDQALKPDQRASIKKTFAGLTEGNRDELLVLEAGMKYQQTSLSPTDMQLLESRRFSIEDVARFMGVPSVLINDTSASTTWGSGIEQINQGFYKLNLKPYLERIESSIKRWLMAQDDWEAVDIEFNFDSLLRADKATRLDSQSKGVNAGILKPNEARAEEGLPPANGGDEIYLNGSLVPAGTNPKAAEVSNGI